MAADEARELLVLYGSQTGYAEDTARRIGRLLWRRHFSTTVQAMDQCDRQQLFTQADKPCPVAIFICSTTGQGDEPDNMRRFWRLLLRKSLPADALEGLQVAVFGMGDSSYDGFNFAAKRLYRRLVQLGARPLVPRGDGDDQHYLGPDGALDPWLDGLWTALEARWPMPRPAVADDVVPAPAFSVQLVNESSPGSGSGAEDMNMRTAAESESRGVFEAELVANERLTAPGHFQDVRRLAFQPLRADVEWQAGDCAVLRPSNDAETVERFLELTGWHTLADAPLAVSGTQLPYWVPRSTTLRWLATHYLDVTSVPRRSFFEMLAYFSPHQDEREKLREFSSAAGQDDLQTYCMRPRRTLLESLADFPNSQKSIPLAYALDVFPAIAERSFSISSAQGIVDLTVAIVHYRTIMQVPRTGLCTRWMSAMRCGDRVQMRIARGTMHLPEDPETPVIMVGPGTGIAAFMAFIHKRVLQGARANHLFFGCRGQHSDYLYRGQLLKWVEDGWLHLYCAFSRDDPERKDYVQNRIEENAAVVWHLIGEDQATVYVSGNANRMPQDVRQAFVAAIAGSSGMDHEQASAYVRAMEKQRRYQEECWY
ncbi:NADPH-dependent diflavin oxidoreductase 1 [Coemansia sp. Benny D115]|nr:NADPH-dependent diflavin oxidoreductase 1 [Coemansia sp. Benny D115]